MSTPVHLKFLIDGKPLTERRWSYIPRLGDEITFESTVDGKVLYRVVNVIWVNNSEDFDYRTDEQRINIGLVISKPANPFLVTPEPSNEHLVSTG
jgi:hypothetical protein